MSQNLDLDPFWWEAAPRRKLDEKPLPVETDVAIVGSGFAGSSAGLVLARAGRKVTVLEKDRPGEGASSRNGGIASGNLRMTFGTMIKTYGVERAKARRRFCQVLVGPCPSSRRAIRPRETGRDVATLRPGGRGVCGHVPARGEIALVRPPGQDRSGTGRSDT